MTAHSKELSTSTQAQIRLLANQERMELSANPDYVAHPYGYVHKDNLAYSVDTSRLPILRAFDTLGDTEKTLSSNVLSYNGFNGEGIYYDADRDITFHDVPDTGEQFIVENHLQQVESPMLEHLREKVYHTANIDDAFAIFHSVHTTNPLNAIALLEAIMNKFPGDNTKHQVNDLLARTSVQTENEILISDKIEDPEVVLEGMVSSVDFVTDVKAKNIILDSLEGTADLIAQKTNDSHHTADLTDAIKKGINDLMHAPAEADPRLTVLVEMHAEERRVAARLNQLRQSNAPQHEISSVEQQLSEIKRVIQLEISPARAVATTPETETPVKQHVALAGVRGLLGQLISRR